MAEIQDSDYTPKGPEIDPEGPYFSFSFPADFIADKATDKIGKGVVVGEIAPLLKQKATLVYGSAEPYPFGNPFTAKGHKIALRRETVANDGQTIETFVEIASVEENGHFQGNLDIDKSDLGQPTDKIIIKSPSDEVLSEGRLEFEMAPRYRVYLENDK